MGKHPDAWRSFPFGWLFLPVSLIGQPFSQKTRDHFLPLLTSKQWWSETQLELRKVFSQDADFQERMFARQRKWTSAQPTPQHHSRPTYLDSVLQVHQQSYRILIDSVCPAQEQARKSHLRLQQTRPFKQTAARTVKSNSPSVQHTTIPELE